MLATREIQLAAGRCWQSQWELGSNLGWLYKNKGFYKMGTSSRLLMLRYYFGSYGYYFIDNGEVMQLQLCWWSSPKGYRQINRGIPYSAMRKNVQYYQRQNTWWNVCTIRQLSTYLEKLPRKKNRVRYFVLSLSMWVGILALGNPVWYIRKDTISPWIQTFGSKPKHTFSAQIHWFFNFFIYWCVEVSGVCLVWLKLVCWTNSALDWPSLSRNNICVRHRQDCWTVE